MLEKVLVPSSIDKIPISSEITGLITDATSRIEVFQDRWDQPQIEQFVSADYKLVFQAICWMLESQLTIGDRFLEWGSGFAVVSALASTLRLDAFGIESEPSLMRQGRKLILDYEYSVELTEGNFLPIGAEELADDPTFPSVGHPVDSAYDSLGLDLDDFAIIYAYPWPGEDGFHEAVFNQYAAFGALLMLFCGPNDIRLWRKRR